MATNKTTKKVTAVKPAIKKAPTVKGANTTVTRVSTTSRVKTSLIAENKLPANLINIIIAELIGTFILTLTVLFSSFFMSPLYVGLVLVVMMLSIGAISGAHINPAVTFGFWTMRKLKTALVPFYWAAQFLGAMAAVVLLGALSLGGFAIQFDQFLSFSWGIFAIELIGTAVFMFGFAAVLNRIDLKSAGKAVGIGMSLTLGLVVAGAMLPFAQDAAMSSFQEKQAKNVSVQEKKSEATRTYPRELYIGSATLNPAVALAVTEKTDSQLQSGNPVAQKDEKSYTRLGIEVILATLIGAALGGNLFLLVNYRSRFEA